ncbi:MAG: hypothetical protein JOZ77_02050 [Candidatus Eremiobacteraeota bacterium]|nr:hypothetical protein [Candidatus Eremiobacteraeota bacterium]
MPKLLRTLLLLLPAGLALSACSATSGGSAAPPIANAPGANFPSHSARKSWISPAAKTQPILYVANFDTSTVYIYAQKGKNQAPIGQLTGLNHPSGLYVTKSGDLYVANTDSADVPVFHRGATTPFEVLNDFYNDRGGTPFDVAVDQKGTAYVANALTSATLPGNIAVFAFGNTDPTALLTDPNYTSAVGVATDNKNNVFGCFQQSFQNGPFLVDEFPAGSTTPKNLGLNIQSCFGLRIDPKQNLVNPDSAVPQVEIFKPGATTPSSTFAKTGYPLFVALTKNAKRIYVSEYDGVVNEYTYPQGKFVDAITNGLAGYHVYGVATDPSPKT